MAELHPDEIERINISLSKWRQGDAVLEEGNLFFLHLAELSCPLTLEAFELAQEQKDQEGGCFGVGSAVIGFAIVTQTCDIVRSCEKRPYVEVSPVVKVEPQFLREVRQLQRPGFAYLPNLANQNLVVDLDRTMTIEKSIVAQWVRIPGWIHDEDGRKFAEALARKRSRFAFPDNFVKAAQDLQKYLKKEHKRDKPEGAHLRALREIRVKASPSWDAEVVTLDFWFIKETEPEGHAPRWDKFVEDWIELFDQSGRFRIDLSVACWLEDMTARDYVDSDHLDLDQLSYSETAD